jgi:hypothetical protein
MLYLGSIQNRDGFGLFNEKGEVFKRCERFSHKYTREIISRFIGSKFVVAHNRLATHGEAKKGNTHPFRVGRILFVHNGMMKGSSMAEAIGNTTKEVGGQYSVFAFDTESGGLWYFKNNAEMSFATLERKKDRVIVASTDPKNLLQIYKSYRNGRITSNFNELKVTEIKDDVIYMIADSGPVEVGEFEANDDYTGLLSWGRYDLEREDQLEDSLADFYPEIEIEKVSRTHATVRSKQFIVDFKEFFTNYVKGTISFENLEWIAESLLQEWDYKWRYY